ncbi:hypothetical protein, partial [Klebsiella pneumoniae]|uniref:hypothetical protein n=1 Tax=Klebsiella pneumoniae TaxID=573 RepID=UPI002731F7BD
SAELFALLQGCHDRLAQMIDAVADGLPVGSVDKLIERIKSLVHPSDEPVVISAATASFAAWSFPSNQLTRTTGME